MPARPTGATPAVRQFSDARPTLRLVGVALVPILVVMLLLVFLLNGVDLKLAAVGAGVTLLLLVSIVSIRQSRLRERIPSDP